MRIYIKNKHNFEFFLLLMFAIIFLILSIAISAIYGTDTLLAVLGFFVICCIICCLVIIAVMLIILAICGIVILIKNTFGIKCDRLEGKDKSGKKKKK